MKIQSLPTTPGLAAARTPAAPAEKPPADRFEPTAFGEAVNNLPSVARGAVLGLGTVTPPLLGGVAFGVAGALVGGATAFGVQYALDKNPRRALAGALGPTILGGLVGLSAAAPTPLRLAGAAGLGVLAGVAAVLRQDLEEKVSQPEGPIRAINRPGQRVDVEAHLVPGKVNIVDFSADWCPGCQELAPGLERFVTDSGEHVLLKVDIEKWKSPVCEQYGLKRIPNIRIYDGQGQLVSEGEAALVQAEAWAGKKS